MGGIHVDGVEKVDKVDRGGKRVDKVNRLTS